jgi:tRNA-dihydrouridine synthase B
MLSVHGRTREDKYNGMAEYDTIKEVKSQVNIPVIANGDITSAEKAQQVLDYTLADGVMVGRATQGNPWIISEINHFLKTGKKAPNIPLKVKKQTILGHISQIHQFYGEKMGTQLSRKHIFWYATHFDEKNVQTFWKKVNKITDHKLQYQLLEEFLQSL